MPYVRIRTRVRSSGRRRLALNLRVFLAVSALSIAAGFVATAIGNRANDARSVSLEKFVTERKQKVIESYKEKYGDNWKEKALADYKKHKQSSR